MRPMTMEAVKHLREDRHSPAAPGLTLTLWGQFRRSKRAVKLHTLRDVRGSIPTRVDVTGG
jgi:hypothetical protein